MSMASSSILGRDRARAWESCRRHVRNAAVYALRSFDQETIETREDSADEAARFHRFRIRYPAVKSN
jgi:hypothetical protein